MPKDVKYGLWKNEDMQRALEAVRNSEVGLNAASHKCSSPRATLKRHIDGKNYFEVEDTQVISSLVEIPPHVEEELVNYILQLEERMIGTTVTDLRLLAFYIAELNHFSLRYNKHKETSVKKWYYGFMRQHTQLSLKRPIHSQLN